MKIHERENNSESQNHLEENRDKFSQQCLKVLELLLNGKRLTTISAPSYGILSLPRRIADLREKNGIIVDEKWLVDNDGKRTIKEWFIQAKTNTEKKELRELLRNKLPVRETGCNTITQQKLF